MEASTVWAGRGWTALTNAFAPCAIAIFLTLFANDVPAQTDVGFRSAPLVIHNDRGGGLQDRLHELSQLRRQNRRVEIRGNVCFSTCTMFLGLPDTCVSPTTTFGFHGPSAHGRPLDPAAFNRASTVIADHYPPALRQWYMDTGRFRINRMYRMSGQTLINLGVQGC